MTAAPADLRTGGLTNDRAANCPREVVLSPFHALSRSFFVVCFLHTLFAVSHYDTRLRVVPHFSSGIVKRAKRERAWKSPHARKGDTRRGERKTTRVASSRVGWFHARSRFARFTIHEEKWGTTRSLLRYLTEDHEVIPIIRSLMTIHPAQERLVTPPGSTFPTLFEEWYGSFLSHKNQINESAVMWDSQFLVLIRED